MLNISYSVNDGKMPRDHKSRFYKNCLEYKTLKTAFSPAIVTMNMSILYSLGIIVETNVNTTPNITA